MLFITPNVAWIIKQYKHKFSNTRTIYDVLAWCGSTWPNGQGIRFKILTSLRFNSHCWSCVAVLGKTSHSMLLMQWLVPGGWQLCLSWLKLPAYLCDVCIVCSQLRWNCVSGVSPGKIMISWVWYRYQTSNCVPLPIVCILQWSGTWALPC